MQTTPRQASRQRFLQPQRSVTPRRRINGFVGTRSRSRFSLTGEPIAHREAVPEVTPAPTWKRGLDLTLVFLFLPVALVLGLLVACWVKLVSPGRLIFRQTRIGHGGQPFTIYKFRSMHFRAATATHEAHVERLIRSNKSMTKLDLIGDERVIFGGCILRTMGLDELPQLINVIRGEMSIVGPRPCVSKEFELHHAEQLRRFSVLPGVTGAWQVNRNEETTFREMVEMDCDYANNHSLSGDLVILLRTPLALGRQLVGCLKRRFQSAATAVEGLEANDPTTSQRSR